MSGRGEKRRRKHARHLRGVEARRRNEARPQEIPDRRSVFSGVTEFGGKPVAEETFVVVVEPIKLPDGKELFFQSPHVEPFFLLEAKRLRDGAEPKRLEAITRTITTPDGSFRPKDPGAAFDALHGLAVTAILAAAAVESYANDAIGRLPDDAMVEVPARLGGKTVPIMRDKPAMDRLPITDKLRRAVPLLTGLDPVAKGTKVWQDYRRVLKLRNALMHLRRQAWNDSANPSPFGRLLLGEASEAPEAAAALIEELEPGWIPEHVRPEFGLPPKVA